MQPICIKLRLFYIIIIDFILVLLIVKAIALWTIKGFDMFNYIMPITYKFFKRLLLILEYSIYKVKHWAKALIIILLIIE